MCPNAGDATALVHCIHTAEDIVKLLVRPVSHVTHSFLLRDADMHSAFLLRRYGWLAG